MKVTDLTISAKLTITTTAAVLMIYLLVSGLLLLGVVGLYAERADTARLLLPEADAELDDLLRQKTVRSIETAGALLAELAASDPDAWGDGRLAALAALAAQDPELAYVDVKDRQGATLTGSSLGKTGTFREFPVERGGEEIGTVVIGLSRDFEPEVEAQLRERLTGVLADIEGQRDLALALIVALTLVGALLAGGAIYLSIAILSRRFILSPAERIRQALTGMERRRDFSERLEAAADDELGRTVAAFNRGIDYLDRQNEQLNDSIIEMLEVSHEISMARDLTRKVPMKEDITGPLRDALNRITDESGRVLLQVREIAERVGRACAELQAQGRQVVEVANAERDVIEQTATDLAQTVEAIDGIAELARSANEAAEQASVSTDRALEAVNGAVRGMGNIRGTIQETGKRIKRLGERSQEISGIVDIINSFAERTHVLAINASMQAATAGEAGRGFAVVAQEVQRLADSSRNATGQIATLIGNIQVETADTIQTVNQATDAVGIESRTIEGAGEEMIATHQAALDLAEAVRQIDARATAQAAANKELMARVDSMRASTVETTDRIDQQTRETNSLAHSSKQLLEAIQLFRLPAPAGDASPPTSLKPSHGTPA